MATETITLARTQLSVQSTDAPTPSPRRADIPTTNRADIDDQTSRLPFGRLMLVYACLSTAYFTSTLDTNAVASALPAIGNSLNASNTITWAGTAYLMGQAAFQPLYGRLSDIFGRKSVLVMSLGFIVAGGLLCGYAQTPLWLYVCRALSGIGGGGVSSVVQIVVSDLVSMRDRGKYQGILSAAIGLGACTGPFIAADMLRRGEESWRWIFWIPSMLAGACVVCMWFLLPLKPVTGSWQEKIRKIDWYGLVAAVVAMVFLLVSIALSSSVSYLFYSVSARQQILTINTATHQLRRINVALEQRSSHLHALHRRSQLARLLHHSKAPSQAPHDPTETIRPALNTSPFPPGSSLRLRVASRSLLPTNVLSASARVHEPTNRHALTPPVTFTERRWVDLRPTHDKIRKVCSDPHSDQTVMTAKLYRFGPVLWTGFALWLLGVGLKVNFSRTTPTWVEIITLIIEGTGIGFVHQPGKPLHSLRANTPLNSTALVALQALCKPQDRAVATSTRNLMRMLGAVTGLAVSTAVQYAVTQAALPDGYDIDTPGNAPFNVLAEARMKGVRTIFIIMVPLIAVCGVGCFFVPNAVLEGDERPRA